MLNPDSLVGKQIDQFRLEAFIAKGAMGFVFKAFDSMLTRTVALKVIPRVSESGLSDSEALSREEGRKRLIQEAKAAGKLAHPNIVTIHSYGENEEFQYICMEYITGRTLTQILRENGPFAVEEALPILDQMLQALDAADAESIVHRDIKPSNIMMTDDGRVKVMDFGIAKLPSLSMTVTGMVLGTPYYMSPEQISGRKVDIRSDIFSLGAVFYEMLTGEKAFQGESTATLTYKIIQVDPVPINKINVLVPEPLANLVSKALNKDPESRFLKPREMLAALRAIGRARQATSQETILGGGTRHEAVPAGKDVSSIEGMEPPSPPLRSAEKAAAAAKSGSGDSEEIQEHAKPVSPADDGRKPGTGPAPQKAGQNNLPAMLIVAVIIVCAAAGFWYFSGPSQNTQGPQKSGSAPSGQVGTMGMQSAQSVDSLLLAAGKVFTSNPPEARRLLDQALGIDPNSYDTMLSLARLSAYTKDYNQAIDMYRKALRVNGRAADAHWELGSLYLAQGQWDNAIQVLEACLSLNPHNRDEVLANLGFCYSQKGNQAQARLLYQQSLELNPNNVVARSFMASLPAETTTKTAPPPVQPPVQQSARNQQGSTDLSRDVIRLASKPGGNYVVDGVNPNGSKYTGGAVIKQNGDRFTVVWNIADKIFTGTGTMSGNVFTVNYKDQAGGGGVVVYDITPSGLLVGKWSDGKAKENLKPVN